EQGIDAIQAWCDQGGVGPPSDVPDWSTTDRDGRAVVPAEAFWNDLVAVTPTTSGHVILVRGAVAKGDVVEIVLRRNRFWRVPVVDGVDARVKPELSVEFGTEGDFADRDSFRPIT